MVKDQFNMVKRGQSNIKILDNHILKQDQKTTAIYKVSSLQETLNHMRIKINTKQIKQHPLSEKETRRRISNYPKLDINKKIEM